MFTFCSNFNSPIQKCFEYTFVGGQTQIDCRLPLKVLKPKPVLFDQAWIIITNAKGAHGMHIHLS